jgi:hypothetical protein
MPRTVRNFWIDLEVDGRKHRIKAGPKSKSGGFACKILQRADGEIYEKDLVISGNVISENGFNKSLILRVWVDGEVIFSRTTKV